MKDYVLTKTNLYDLPIKKIHYSFKVGDIQPLETPKYLIIHHTGNTKTIQKIINLHIKKKMWASIGYHFLIGKNGQIYYARDIKLVGAHTKGFNTKAIGIALFGNFNEIEPSKKQLESLNLLVTKLKKEKKIQKILGHNEAIYSELRNKYKKLPKTEILSIKDDISYYSFLKKISEIVDKNDPLLEKFKTCPGFNMYEHIKKL